MNVDYGKRKRGTGATKGFSSGVRYPKRRKQSYVPRLRKGESKWKDTKLNAAAILAAGTGASVVTMVAGTGASQIIGDEATLSRLSWKLNVTNSAAGLGGMIRVLVVKSITSQISLVTDVLTTGGGGAAVTVDSMINMVNRKKIRVLSDTQQFLASKVAGTFQGDTSLMFKGSVKLNEVATVAGGVCTSNDVWYIIIAEQTANQPTVTGTLRLRYNDQ